jgi:DNA polymerase-3 subunit beta
LEATDEGLCSTANNLDMSIRAVTEADVREPGSVVLPGKFVEIIKRLPGEMVEIKSRADNKLQLEIRSNDSQFVLNGADPENFPESPTVDPNKWSFASFTEAELKEVLERCLFAVSRDISKPVFTGIEMQVNGSGTLTCTATDTFRLARVAKPLAEQSDSFNILVPGKNIEKLLKIIGDSEDTTVSCYFNNRELVVLYKQFSFSLRLLDDAFPKFENIFPEKPETIIEVDKALLQSVLRRAQIVSENNIVFLSVCDGTLSISASSEAGRMNETLALKNVSGEELDKIALNSLFLIEPLKVLDNETITVNFNGSVGPCVFDHGSYRYLALPIRLPEAMDSDTKVAV